MITGVNVTVLGVRDVDRSTRFYVDDLGARPVRLTEPMPGRRWHEIGFADGARLALLNADGWHLVARPGPALTVVCDDVVATVAELRARNVEVTDPRTTPWGTSAQLTDPDGHLIILGESSTAAADR